MTSLAIVVLALFAAGAGGTAIALAIRLKALQRTADTADARAQGNAEGAEQAEDARDQTRTSLEAVIAGLREEIEELRHALQTCEGDPARTGRIARRLELMLQELSEAVAPGGGDPASGPVPPG